MMADPRHIGTAWYVVFDLPAQTTLIAVEGVEAGGQIESGGKTYNLRAGPFSTRQAAEAYIAKQPVGQGGGTGTTGTDTGTGTTAASSGNGFLPWPLGGISSGISGISEAGHWLGVLVSAVTDSHLWISLGWITLGLILLVLGVYLFIRLSSTYARAEQAVISTAGKL